MTAHQRSAARLHAAETPPVVSAAVAAVEWNECNQACGDAGCTVEAVRIFLRVSPQSINAQVCRAPPAHARATLGPGVVHLTVLRHGDTGVLFCSVL